MLCYSGLHLKLTCLCFYMSEIRSKLIGRCFYLPWLCLLCVSIPDSVTFVIKLAVFLPDRVGYRFLLCVKYIDFVSLLVNFVRISMTYLILKIRYSIQQNLRRRFLNLNYERMCWYDQYKEIIRINRARHSFNQLQRHIGIYFSELHHWSRSRLYPKNSGSLV